MAKQSGPERIAHMVDVLKHWQGIERQAMNDTAEIMEGTESSLVRIVMEIIRHDSMMHHRVQQFLIDSVTREAVNVTREDLAQIWEKIEEHDKMEKKTIELATELCENAWSPIHKQLLTYLLTDEKKHDELLEQFESVKAGMNRASGA
jgi:hypothetical protein